ncbi:MAG: ankyrin repeat domain-containing protein [Hamadaea sp.]|uniref:ankyrin repeat domain-containing protein n=1 Tax=Hamadaea sp. TaxID=2024425 RepID=UPI00180758E5|nr:ankyrin repeat domain-containing protein [Hamadaea sp.]NUT21766.1 ankyrin repeat domain-containing protein [Hamadaea sp.]
MLASLRDDLPQWRRIRALTVPPAMIAAATAARESGDWRAAAAAARVDVQVDMDVVRQKFGAEATAALEADLHHLAPDLLWWHLPRHRAGMITLLARRTLVLPPEHGGTTGPHLRFQTPMAPFGPQRLRLSVDAFEDLEFERWIVMPRYTWDVRRSGELAEAWGVGDPAAAEIHQLLAAGAYVEAWRRCGIEVESEEGLQPRPELPTCPIGVAREVREVARIFGVDKVGALHATPLMFTLSGDTISAAAAEYYDLYEVPSVAVEPVPADLALLDAGLLGPEDLHPLVRAALPDDLGTSRHTESVTVSAVAGPVRVRCRGTWHTLSVESGALRLHDHSDEELQRESVLRSLGGASAGCFAVRHTWLTGEGRLPKALARHVRTVCEHAQVGDTDWLVAGLRTGTIDPLMRGPGGRSLLHVAMMVDHDRLLPFLDAAGLGVDVQDRTGRTPLYLAIMGGARREYIQALLDRGADPTIETVHGADAYTATWRGSRWVRDMLPQQRRG